jgi:hypothetical protein
VEKCGDEKHDEHGKWFRSPSFQQRVINMPQHEIMHWQIPHPPIIIQILAVPPILTINNTIIKRIINPKHNY